MKKRERGEIPCGEQCIHENIDKLIWLGILRAFNFLNNSTAFILS